MSRECTNNYGWKSGGKRAVRRGKSKGVPASTGRLSEKRVRQEAQSCFGLRTCEACETCALFCPELCITRPEGSSSVEIDLDYCKGCGICAVVCPKGAIRMVLEEGA